MADNDGITRSKSFTERTLKYGRNMMAAAVPIIVFALVPLVDLAESRPFNFEIKEGGEIWIWLILSAFLMYYGFRFFGLAIPDFHEWRKQHGESRASLKSALENNINDENVRRGDLASNRDKYDQTPNPDERERLQTRKAILESQIQTAQDRTRATRSELSDYNWRRTYFWLADAGLPVALFAAAVIAASIEISTLLPPDPPSSP